jgi:hypothetical protein
MTTEQILQALEQFARKMRSASHWCNDGYYTTEAEGQANAAKREVYDEIASSLDQAFDFDTSDWKPKR